jgi:NADPH:quinone reductase-like Zn-dependent oxidoreductase
MVQIATANGITVIASVRSSEEAQFCIGLGAKMAVDVTSERVAHKVMDFTRGKGVDLVIDIGSVPPSENTACLALEGRLVVLAATDQKVPIIPSKLFDFRNRFSTMD